MPATTVFADFERDFADFESMTQMDRFPVSRYHLSLHYLAVLLVPIFGIIRIGHFQSTHFQ